MKSPSVDDRLLRAMGGDADALTGLLLDRYGLVERYVTLRLPAEVRGLLDPGDIVQDVNIEAFRTIGRFVPSDGTSFDRWLTTIARQRLLDRIRAFRRKKREGAGRRVLNITKRNASSGGTLLDVLAMTAHTPSRSAARRERERAVVVALAAIKKEYRDALQFRYIEGWPVNEIAKKMKRTDRAIHMLCNRGLKKLREAMGNASRFMSSS